MSLPTILGFIYIVCFLSITEALSEISLTRRDNVKTKIELKSRANQKSLKVEWVPMNCMLEKEDPNACSEKTCSVTFNASNLWPFDGKFRLQPFLKQRYSDCDPLVEALKTGFNNRGKIKEIFPVEGCRIIKLPRTDTAEEWKRCIETPLQPLPSDKYQDGYTELKFTTTFENNETETSFIFTGLPDRKDKKTLVFPHVPWLWMQRGLGFEHKIENCTRLVTVRNTLPVPVKVEIKIRLPSDEWEPSTLKSRDFGPFEAVTYDVSNASNFNAMVTEVKGVFHTYRKSVIHNAADFRPFDKSQNCTTP